MIEPGYAATEGKAAADIVTDLESLGYNVTLETMTATNPATWENYDLLHRLERGEHDHPEQRDLPDRAEELRSRAAGTS